MYQMKNFISALLGREPKFCICLSLMSFLGEQKWTVWYPAIHLDQRTAHQLFFFHGLFEVNQSRCRPFK